MKVGRPSLYTPELADEICDRIANGKSLVTICKQKGMPKYSTITGWLADKPEFSEKYARAREAQADYLAEQILELADKSRKGKKTESKLVEIKDADGKLTTAPEIKTITGDMVERSRLQIDARKWYASKLAPKKYGDTLKHTGDPDNPVHVKVDREELIGKLIGNRTDPPAAGD
jgi:hypothetical protein